MKQNHRTNRVQKMAGLSLLSAIIVVVQIICTFVKFGPVNITLALAPIIVGAAVYGTTAGVVLGVVHGLVVFLSGVLGWDGGFVMSLMSINAIGLILVCFGKSIAAGWLSGLVYRLLARKNDFAAVVTAGIVCPLVNTGLFILGMLLFFFSSMEAGAAATGDSMLYYIIVSVAGINFLVELASNLVLATGISRIIRFSKHR